MEVQSSGQIWSHYKKHLLKASLPSLMDESDLISTQLSFYDLVHVAVNENSEREEPLFYSASNEDTKAYLAFTDLKMIERMGEGYKTKTYMLGELVRLVQDAKKVKAIKINPVKINGSKSPVTLAEDFVMVPLFDEVTKKSLLTDPEEALALLAIHPEDQARLGIEFVFYCLTSKHLPEDKEERESVLRQKVEELAFYAPRVPLRKGSASLLCVVLNLENSMEEAAFIRNYRTFDKHADLIFVTSALEILTGELERISYDGEHIDGIFGPLIEWQKIRQQKSQSLNFLYQTQSNLKPWQQRV